ncbi:MAG TPA: glycosyltransferase [Flavobacterium sp.]|jgi:glycosyltransferase involved in cell wall biosynthesis
MKVLQIINNLGTGGAEKLLLQAIPLYNREGIETDLLVLNGKQHPFMKEFAATGCKVISLGSGSVYNPMHIFRLMKHISKYDIIHAHLFPSLYWVAFAKWLSFSKVRLVFTEHNTHNRRRNNFLLKIVDNLVYSIYNRIICITQEVLDALSTHIAQPDKLLVIVNGVELESVPTTVAYPKSAIDPGINDTDVLLVQVAAFRPQKDQATLIRAMELLPSAVKLVLVGDGMLRPEMEKLTSELGLTSRVFFLGVRTDVQKLLKTADICILSSHWEGFGLAAVEGMAAGKPFIASNVAGLAEVVNGAGILFEPGNENDLAQKITALSGDADYYNAVALKCRERAQKFDIRKMVQSYINVYNQLART